MGSSFEGARYGHSILGIDPGSKHCGYALGYVNPVTSEVLFQDSGEASPEKLLDVLNSIGHGTDIAIERYHIAPRSLFAVNTEVIELIGVIKYLAKGMGAKVVIINPSATKAVKLTKSPHMSPHTFDAMRVCIAAARSL